VLSGSGDPGGGTGVNGDFYLDLSNSVLYGPKTAGVRPAPGTTLTGPTGATGPTGPTGPVGGPNPPQILRGYSTTNVRVPGDRVLVGAKVKCIQGPCQIRKIQVRFVVANRIFNGIGRGPDTVVAGQIATLRVTMPIGLHNVLMRGRVSGTVSFMITAKSSNGSRTTDNIRTGLRR